MKITKYFFFLLILFAIQIKSMEQTSTKFSRLLSGIAASGREKYPKELYPKELYPKELYPKELYPKELWLFCDEILKNNQEVSPLLVHLFNSFKSYSIKDFFHTLPKEVQKTITLEFIIDLKDKMGDNKWKDIEGRTFSYCTVLHKEIEGKNEVSKELQQFLNLLSGDQIGHFFYHLPDTIKEKITLSFIINLYQKENEKWKDIKGHAFSNCAVLFDQIKGKDTVSEDLKKFLDLLSGEQIGQFFYHLPDTVQEKITLEFIKDLKNKMGDNKWKDIAGRTFSYCTVLHKEIEGKDVVPKELQEFLNSFAGWKLAGFFYYLPDAVQEKITLLFIQDLIKIKKDIKGDAFSGCTVLHKEIEGKNTVSENLKSVFDLLDGLRLGGFFNNLPKGVQEKTTLPFIQDLKKKIGSYKFSQFHDDAFLKFSLEVKNKFQELKAAAAEEAKKQNAAATRIQSLYKGYKVRKEKMQIKSNGAIN